MRDAVVISLRLAALLSLAFVAACGDEPAAGTRPPLAAVQTRVVQAGTADGGRAWDGVVEAVQRADLSAQTTGRVTEVGADVDDRVARGDLLVRITAFEQQAGANAARAQVRAAEAAASEAEANYERFSALASAQYVSRAQLDQARAARDSAIATRDAARATLAQATQQAAYTEVRAPFAGVVGARHVEPGETVAPGRPLVSVHAPGALRVEVQVPQSDAAAIRAANGARILLEDGRGVDASRVIVFPAAQAETHSVGVRLLLPDMEDAPRPGATAKVVFPVAGASVAPHVPYGTLVQRGEVSAVYVVASGRVGLRQVRVGRRVGDDVEILAGLKPGERIASDPVEAMRALAAQRERAAHE